MITIILWRPGGADGPRSQTADYSKHSEQRENFELGSEQMPENAGLRTSVLNRSGTELGRKTAHQRTKSPEEPLAKSRGPRQNNAHDWAYWAAEGLRESRPFAAVAEGEELKSNILRVPQRSPANFRQTQRMPIRAAKSRHRWARLGRATRPSEVDHKAVRGDEHASGPDLVEVGQYRRVHVGDHDLAGAEVG